ncbi:GNAT family N-acetyltransferase [Halorubrum sp. JWXQ-INN 858]|uniref:GNAT family N-acetyltransferase n=1 Tax=Halorubrum sp. JWXQ-INN 858 TaxID=2690782 RepID=UPI00135B6545|nr:GNAT family N-acetyltransferase [Halorubrum sp. JWXQ-INN 858]MWV63895.1 GNAT family N-acetyltransferase [Halorubrum sp. JWXQ-INN 858]
MSSPDDPRITAATAADIDAVTDLWVALARGQRDHGSGILAERNRGAVRESIARHVVVGELLVARVGGEAVGFVDFSVDRGGYERDHVRGTVGNLFVAPEHRGEGIGSALLAAAERGLREAGADVVGLEAMAANERAREFYRAHGYEPHRVTFTKAVDAAGSDADAPADG